MSDYQWDMESSIIRRLNEVTRSDIRSGRVRYTPLSVLLKRDILIDIYKNGARLWSYNIENENTLRGTSSRYYNTKEETLKELIKEVRNKESLDGLRFYIAKDKYIKLYDKIKIINEYREEIHFCSNCRLPLLSCESYQKINDMYFHKSDCNTYELERRISWKTPW